MAKKILRITLGCTTRTKTMIRIGVKKILISLDQTNQGVENYRYHMSFIKAFLVLDHEN